MDFFRPRRWGYIYRSKAHIESANTLIVPHHPRHPRQHVAFDHAHYIIRHMLFAGLALRLLCRLVGLSLCVPRYRATVQASASLRHPAQQDVTESPTSRTKKDHEDAIAWASDGLTTLARPCVVWMPYCPLGSTANHPRTCAFACVGLVLLSEAILIEVRYSYQSVLDSELSDPSTLLSVRKVPSLPLHDHGFARHALSPAWTGPT